MTAANALKLSDDKSEDESAKKYDAANEIHPNDLRNSLQADRTIQRHLTAVAIESRICGVFGSNPLFVLSKSSVLH
jgi:hypothetical protein